MLQVLPQSVSNLIAAGEVVARPASVVKELMENAVDAGAKSVSVSVLDAGKTLIQVIDDGCGMSPEEAVLCFERHATSKLASADDLQHIRTYGFRGEALPSIAAVAEVTLRTRRPDDETGTQVDISESHPAKSRPVAAPAGTQFAVRNLFCNVPARRKFLKSDSAELRAVIQEFLRIALIRPELAFRLTSNGKEIHNLRPAASCKKRILDIYGMNLAKELVEVNVDTTIVRISGYIGNPEDARKSGGNQFFFVNGRYADNDACQTSLFTLRFCKFFRAADDSIADGVILQPLQHAAIEVSFKNFFNQFAVIVCLRILLVRMMVLYHAQIQGHAFLRSFQQVHKVKGFVIQCHNNIFQRFPVRVIFVIRKLIDFEKVTGQTVPAWETDIN